MRHFLPTVSVNPFNDYIADANLNDPSTGTVYNHTTGGNSIPPEGQFYYYHIDRGCNSTNPSAGVVVSSGPAD